MEAQVTIDLSVAANWDDYADDGDWDSTNYATASNRVGKDFYVYAVHPDSGTAPAFILSENSTTPIGYSASTSRKLGGFHTLCLSAGTITNHPASDMLLVISSLIVYGTSKSDLPMATTQGWHTLLH